MTVKYESKHAKKRKKKRIINACIGLSVIVAACVLAVILLGNQQESPYVRNPISKLTKDFVDTKTQAGAEVKLPEEETEAEIAEEAEAEPFAALEDGSYLINGKKYNLKKGLKTVLYMGIDQNSDSDKKLAGQADALGLIVYDKNNKTYTRLPLNRATMVTISSLDEEGNELAQSVGQLALAHGVAFSRKDGIKNTLRSVSKLFFDLPITEYVEITLDSIPEINQLVGGVPVTIEDDFSKEDPSLVMGETITLNDDQAISFLRGRMSVADGTNANRMSRQQAYLSAAKPLLMQKIQEDKGFALKIYDTMKPYMLSSMKGGPFSKWVLNLYEAEELDCPVLEGSYSINERTGYEEYRLDEVSLAEAAAQLFFEPAE